MVIVPATLSEMISYLIVVVKSVAKNSMDMKPNMAVPNNRPGSMTPKNVKPKMMTWNKK